MPAALLEVVEAAAADEEDEAAAALAISIISDSFTKFEVVTYWQLYQLLQPPSPR